MEGSNGGNVGGCSKELQGKKFEEQRYKKKTGWILCILFVGCLHCKFIKVEGALPKCQEASSLALCVHFQNNVFLFTELSEQGNWVHPWGRQRTQQCQRPKIGPRILRGELSRYRSTVVVQRPEGY